MICSCQGNRSRLPFLYLNLQPVCLICHSKHCSGEVRNVCHMKIMSVSSSFAHARSQTLVKVLNSNCLWLLEKVVLGFLQCASLNSAAWLVFSSSRFDHITPLLRQLYWLTAAERIQFKLAVLVYNSLHGTAPSYLDDDELQCPADLDARRWLRSTSLSSLTVRHTRLFTVGDRAFPVAVARTWNSLPQHVTSAPFMSVFRGCLKAFLFRRSFP